MEVESNALPPLIRRFLLFSIALRALSNIKIFLGDDGIINIRKKHEDRGGLHIERSSEKAEEHGMKNVRVFGCVVRTEANFASDLDLLVDVEEGKSLFDLIRIKQDMKHLFNREMDVVTENTVHWRIQENVINGAVQL